MSKIFLGYLLFFSLSLSAQELYFSTLSIRDGLPSNIISGVEQDQYDFIWISTSSGLARYDGNKFTVLKKGEGEKSLPNNELTTIAAVGDYLYVGSWDGLAKVNIKTFEASRVDIDNIKTIRVIHKGKNGILWIGTAKGLVRYQLENGKFKIFNQEQNGLSHNMVRSIYEEENGTVWVGTYDGLNYLKKGHEQFHPMELPAPIDSDLKNQLVLDIKPSINHDPNLWVGTEMGLYRVSTNNLKSYPFTNYNDTFSNPVIKHIHTDEEGKLWLGTDFGLNIFDPILKSNSTHFHNPQLPYSIANNVVWQIFEDKNGVLWFATSNGLSRVNKYGNFYQINDISYESDGQFIGNQIKDLLTDSQGNYWMATQHGVIQMNAKNGKKRIFNTESIPRLLLDNVSTLEEDQYGNIWIGTAGGINIWNPKTQIMKTIRSNSKNGLNSNYIGNFSQEPDGTLWVSAWQGALYRIEGNSLEPENITFTSVQSLESGPEKHVYGAPYIWVVEYDKLYRIHPETMETKPMSTFNQAVSNKMIYTLYYSQNEEIWAGTLNGLIQFSLTNDKVTLHPIMTGNDEIVTSITEDLNGGIWSVTNSSIQRLNPEDGQIEIFPLDNNIPIKSFSFGCVSRTSQGEIIFGGDNGFIQFAPDQAKLQPTQPAVYITDLEINNRPVQIGENIGGRTLLNQDISFVPSLELDYNERSFTLQFSSLDYWQPDQNLYKYRLEGYEEAWHQVSGTKNLAIYSNVVPGKYTFHVRAINQYGQNSDSATQLAIVVHPPLLLRPYFIALYVILIIALIYYGLKTYSARVNLKNELKIARLEMEHAEEIERTKENFFTNISHELRTPISLILPPLHQIQKKHKLDPESTNLIDLAEKNSVRLLKLVNQILDFNKIEYDTLQIKVHEVEMVHFCREVFEMFSDKAKRHEIRFELKKDIEEINAWIDTEKLETVLFNLLSNAFKFTSNKGTITLKLSKLDINEDFKNGALRIEVCDTGVGIDPKDQDRIFERFYQAEDGKRKESGSGIGLTLAAEFVDLHHGNIKVESEPGKGTAFTVDIPLGKDHLPVDSIQANEEIELRATPSVHGRQHGSKLYQLDLVSEKPMVLIIDDNTDIIDFVRSSLGHKYNLVIAENGQEGLIKANRFMPQVIISDIMMPVMDGITFCKKIKENPKTSQTAVILLTAKSLTAHKIEGIKIGADAYLTKPFEIELLEAHIDQLIQRKEELTRYFKDELISVPVESDVTKNEDNVFVKRVMDIIEANISNSDLSVEMISEEMAMSSTHLYRKLKAITNHSAKEIIQKYRLKKASLLLQNKEGNITEIVYQTGFNSLSYFSRCFKSEFGTSPKKYQERFRKG
ncbi:hybrid sensor histidine kinase/response regulator transcription factor [Reichenbachiella ulvae]|uniref:histidine kinase n=1 Tax=Reichenbachiella ulvae TaxID=2980104 RepID=A0ABT3CTI2_9BACT|nr:hybrid sensor histidine kinase/response regulator transcription factor [Reichenbachiella ulvae]MCV9387025.1 ATP-binding protein [Reichenbachiella ulvae]